MNDPDKTARSERLKLAMNKLEAAQGLVSESVSDLDYVDGFVHHRSEVGKLHKMLTEHWNMLESMTRSLG